MLTYYSVFTKIIITKHISSSHSLQPLPALRLPLLSPYISTINNPRSHLLSFYCWGTRTIISIINNSHQIKFAHISLAEYASSPTLPDERSNNPQQEDVHFRPVSARNPAAAPKFGRLLHAGELQLRGLGLLQFRNDLPVIQLRRG